MLEAAACGGLAHLDVRGAHLVTVRHCMPLDNLDINEFELPLKMIMLTADDMERTLTGRDDL